MQYSHAAPGEARGRIAYTSVTDKGALDAFHLLSETEGIIPALESAHAVGYAVRLAKRLPKEKILSFSLTANS